MSTSPCEVTAVPSIRKPTLRCRRSRLRAVKQLHFAMDLLFVRYCTSSAYCCAAFTVALLIAVCTAGYRVRELVVLGRCRGGEVEEGAF